MEKNEHIIIDAANHSLKKLSKFVAKKLLCGTKVTVVCCDEIILPHTMKEEVEKFKSFLNKRNIVNPRKGHKHHRQPSMRFWRIVRSMIPYKKVKGKRALNKLTVHDGIPREFEGVQRYKLPYSLFKYTVVEGRAHTTLGDVLVNFGWKHYKLVKELTQSVRNNELKALEAAKIATSKVEEVKNTEEFKNEVSKRLEAYA